MNRIIITGNNRDFPPTRYVGCRECDTDGWVFGCHPDPSVRVKVTCPVCNGDGAVLRKSSPSDAARCLPASGTARPPAFSTAREGRAPSSGMPPDARATGDLSGSDHNRGLGEHTVLRRLQNLSASLSPALPPSTTAPGTLADRIVDVFTVIAGMSVFAMIAMFFLVMA